MFAFLLTILTMMPAQGIPAFPGQSGTVSGIVRTSAGMPAAGVRVSAMVPPEAAADAASADEVAACLSRAGVPARAIGACETARPGIAVRVKP